MAELEGKVAVITGGASGIGEATVRLFVEEGAKVVIADMQRERGEALAAEIGDATIFVPCEVRQEAQVKATVDAAVGTWGRLDCMFNNAGFGGALGPIDETSEEDYDITMDVLLKGVFFGVKHAARVMKPEDVCTLRGGRHLYEAALEELRGEEGRPIDFVRNRKDQTNGSTSDLDSSAPRGSDRRDG